MVHSCVRGIRVAGLRTAVPENRHSYVTDGGDVPADEAAKIAATTGVQARRVAPEHQSSSDLCFYAAQGLMQQLGWAPETVEIIVYVTQDPDYVLPATACVLQDKLGLPTSAVAYDINLGCSGFTYGFWTVASLLAHSSATRALILTGDISTRRLKPGDRSSKPLFGDAGAACALEKDETAQDIIGVFGTDGRGAPHLITAAGGSRFPLVPPEQPHSAETNDDLFTKSRLHMNGTEVFGFSLRAVPKLVRETLEAAGWELDDPDYYVWHQANEFMLKKLRAKLKLPEEKVIIDMAEYGNTSSSSIPLALCLGLSQPLSDGPVKLMLAGFGVGWSWGGLAVEIGPIPKPEIVDVPTDALGLGSVVS